MEAEKKKVSLSLIIIGILVVFLAAYYIYVHFSTTPEEEAYAAAVQKVVEYFDEKNQKALQAQEESEEEETKSYVEKIAREEEAQTHPSFDKYREEYVKKDGDGFLVELPIREMRNEEVVKEYAYEIQVQEKDGKYAVTSMERKAEE